MVTNSNNLRQIGMAITDYALNHKGRLPQCYEKQRARMRNYPGFLSSYTAEYLGVEHEEGEVNPYFGDAAWAAALGTSRSNLSNFLSSQEPNAHRFILNRWEDQGRPHYPFGTPVAPFTPAYPLASISSPATTWAMQDLDAKIVSGHPLKETLWGNKRLTLYFDMHVKAVPEDEFYMGPTP